MLPNSRNFTYNPNDQVRSFDLNDVQDWLINHETLFRGSRDYGFGAGLLGWSAVPADWAPNGNNDIEATVGNPGRFFIGLPLPAGLLITAVTVYLQHTTATAGLMTAKLIQRVFTLVGVTNASSTASSAASTGIQSIPLTSLATLPYSGSSTYEVQIDGTATAATRRIYGVKVTATWP